MRSPQGSTRGRPLADPVDRLRAKLWYWAVKARGGWSDYRLDVEFVRNEGEEKRGGASRRRAFGKIRRVGIVPSPGTHRLRTYDLVTQVDAHPEFAGTAAPFKSFFWDILKAKEMRLSDARDAVGRCMSRYKIFRPTATLDFILMAEAARKSPGNHLPSCDERYKEALAAICEEYPTDLDLLALVGALFREAYLAIALDTATILHEKFISLLEQYCAQEWLCNVKSELFQLAEQKMLYWGVNSDLVEGGHGYDDLPIAVVSRPFVSMNDAMGQLVQDEDELFRKLSEEIVAKLAAGGDIEPYLRSAI